MTLRLMTFNIMALSSGYQLNNKKGNTQRKDTQHDVTQHTDNRHNNTQHTDNETALSITIKM